MLTWNEVVRLAKQGNLEPDRRVTKTEEQWRTVLTADQYRVARQSGTERPFSHSSCQRFEPGVYRCVGCSENLFDSSEKFDSSSGWPSFTQPVKPNSIAYHADSSHGMIRIEVRCNVCDSHLGHVFPDGPEPSGLRYCINGIVLEKVESKEMNDSSPGSPRSAERPAGSGEASDSHLEQATFGGGCFWCTEAVFQQVQGVLRVESGYSGGETENPGYEEVCSGQTGHAEVVQVTYDPAKLSYRDLVTLHLCTHDPTTLNRQGADHGTQYRSIVFYSSPEEHVTAKKVVEEIEEAIGDPVVTELQPFSQFFAAEEVHQNYYQRNPLSGYCSAVIKPKLAHFKKAFSQVLKTENV
jgi:peptide methionine sulfoxide reductase msrA/msrB